MYNIVYGLYLGLFYQVAFFYWNFEFANSKEANYFLKHTTLQLLYYNFEHEFPARIQENAQLNFKLVPEFYHFICSRMKNVEYLT